MASIPLADVPSRPTEFLDVEGVQLSV